MTDTKNITITVTDDAGRVLTAVKYVALSVDGRQVAKMLRRLAEEVDGYGVNS